MANGWVDGYEHKPTENCGSYNAPGAAPKHVLHTTESGFGSIDGIYNFFRDRTLNSPHFTIDPGNWRKMQHAPLSTAACALEARTGVTNGAMAVQTEICGWAATSQDWNDNVLLFIARHLVDVRDELLSVFGRTYPLTCSVTFYGTDAGFTIAIATAPQRLSNQAFFNYSGVLGHQHVGGGNSHWDPGKLNIKRVLELANYIASGGGSVTPPPGGEDMPLSNEDLAAVKQAAKEAILEIVPAGLLNGSWEQDTRALFGGVAVKKPNDPKQFLIGVDQCGPYKLWIRDGQQKDLLIKAGVIRQALTFIELTEPEEIAWLDELPEV